MDGQIYDLNDLRELTTSQYDAARNAAIQRIQKRIGDKPKRADFKQDYAPLWGTLDILAIVIFIAAVMVSSLHILIYAGGQAQNSFVETRAIDVLGIKPTEMIYGLMHQAGLLAIAESAMLLFFVMARLNAGFARWGNAALAALACVFVIVANWNSGLNEFLSLLVPAFTIGIGFRLEDRITENMRRNSEIDTRYRDAITRWDKASSDPTNDSEWSHTLAIEIWQKLVGYKSNASFVDAPPEFRRQAVMRELKKENWAKGSWDTAESTQGKNSRNLTKSHEISGASGKRIRIEDVAREVLENGDSGLPAVDMMEKYGVSMGSTTRIRQILSEQNGHSNNGNGHV